MSKRYDVIIIGAGIGGLSAAAYLVRKGLRVLVLEKSPHPGGTAYVYTRGGFQFPMGPLGFSSPAFVNRALTDLDRPFTKPFLRVHYQIHAFDVHTLLSQPFPDLAKELIQTFPAEEKGIRKFFKKLEETLATMRLPQGKDSGAVLESTASIPAGDYLASFISDWRLRRILGTLGTHEPYSSIPLMAAMWNLMSNEGIWYPPGGMRTLADRLAQAVTAEAVEGFGEIRLGATVQKLNITREKIEGVTLTDGTAIQAGQVISNADFKSTFLRLTPPATLPEPFRLAISRAKQTGSVMQVCLGLDTDKIDLSAFSRASRLLFRAYGNETNPARIEVDWTKNRIDQNALVRQEMELALMTREDKGLAPEGKTVLVIRTEANHGHFSTYRLAERQRTPDYQRYKSGLGQALVREAARIVPGLEKAVLVMDVATPLTFQDQGGRSQGAVAGWSWDFEDSREFSPLELTRTPIGGLFMAGYQAYSALFMGGVPTAMESGRKAAQAVLDDAPPDGSPPIPGGG